MDTFFRSIEQLDQRLKCVAIYGGTSFHRQVSNLPAFNKKYTQIKLIIITYVVPINPGI